MQTNVRATQGISIIEPVSRLMGLAIPELREAVLSQINTASSPTVLFDLRRVRRVDSGGLGVLLAAYKTVQDKSGQTGIINAGKIKNLYIQGCLLQCFDHFETEQAAVSTFLKEPAWSPKP